MTIEEIKSQLRKLIDDRKSLKSSKYCDAIDNEIYDNDTVKHGAAISPPPESKALPCREEIFGNYCSNGGARMDGDTDD